jgi:hypothetical protein
MTIFFFQDFYVFQKWGLLFDERRSRDYYWSLPLYWVVTVLAHSLRLD